VLHVLAVSIPHANGYTFRSKYLIHELAQRGLTLPAVVTSPFYIGEEAATVAMEQEGVRYLRVPHPIDLDGPVSMADRLARTCYRLRIRGRKARRWGAWPNPLRRPLAFLRFGAGRSIRAVERLMRWLRRPSASQAPGETGRLGRLLRALKRKAGLASSHLLMVLATVLSPLYWASRPARRAVLMIRRVGDFTSNQIVRLFTVCEQWLFYVEEQLLLRRFEQGIVAAARAVDAQVIHAHSPYRCGVPASRAARRLGLPFVYEVRGLWEESGVAEENFARGSAKYRFWKAKETQAMLAADRLILICEALRGEAMRRGVDPARISVAPNAVDLKAFDHNPSQADDSPEIAAVRSRLRPFTIGYVGSIRKLEGVEELIRAGGELLRRQRDISVLIVGSGKELPTLQSIAAQEGLGERAVFTGRVPHHEVAAYYGMIDAFVVSRPPLPVCEMVTPLKPLEAMALKRPLIVSDLEALREIVRSGETGLTYRPQDPGHLADQVERLMDDPALSSRLVRQALTFVREQRSWSDTASVAEAAYEAVRAPVATDDTR
jgi:glycosyltransferase involved in cell wall biosynthesis